MRERARRGADLSLCTPGCVPLPEDMRAPVRLQYVGLLREVCKSADLMVCELPEGLPVARIHHLADALLRRALVVAIIAAIFAVRLESSPRSRVLRTAYQVVVQNAELDFPGCGSPTIAPLPRAQALASLRIAQRAAAEAEQLSLQGLDHDALLRSEHVARMAFLLAAAAAAFANFLEAEGWGREAKALRKHLECAAQVQQDVPPLELVAVG